MQPGFAGATRWTEREALNIERAALMQLMAMVFCASALSLALTLAEAGRYDPALRNLSLWAIAPALAGVLAGEWVAPLPTERRALPHLAVRHAGGGWERSSWCSAERDNAHQTGCFAYPFKRLMMM